jgi:hypothetical protein
VRASSTAPLLLTTAVLAALSCGGRAERSVPAQKSAAAREPAASAALIATAPAVATPLAAPREPFVAPEAWHSRMGKPQTIEPPALANETWRVFVNQSKPIQFKTPRWIPLPAQDNVEPEMPEGSTFRCLVTPLQIATDANDFGTKLKAWVLTRTLRCSADGWHSWTEYPHTVRVAPDGTRTVVTAAEALLRQRDAGGSAAGSAAGARETVVLVRADKERREATTGPPRILPGVPVDED